MNDQKLSNRKNYAVMVQHDVSCYVLLTYCLQQTLEAMKNNERLMTTNQKVVGSNPAGLTKNESPEAKKIKAPGIFVACCKLQRIVLN